MRPRELVEAFQEVLMSPSVILPQTVTVADLRDNRKLLFSEDVAGAVLGADSIQSPSNPLVDYSPLLPTSCRDYFRPHVPIHVSEAPQGHVTAIGNELLFSSEMGAFLTQYSGVCRSNRQVVHNSQFLASVCLLEVRFSTRSIGDESYHRSIQCALCSHPYVPTLGAWIARVDCPGHDQPGLGQLGFNHYQIHRPFVLPIAAARAIATLFKQRSYTLEPIYLQNSDFGWSVVQIWNMLYS